LRYPRVPASSVIFVHEPDVFKAPLLASPSPTPRNQRTEPHALERNTVDHSIYQLLGEVLHDQRTRERGIVVPVEVRDQVEN